MGLAVTTDQMGGTTATAVGIYTLFKGCGYIPMTGKAEIVIATKVMELFVIHSKLLTATGADGDALAIQRLLSALLKIGLQRTVH